MGEDFSLTISSLFIAFPPLHFPAHYIIPIPTLLPNELIQFHSEADLSVSLINNSGYVTNENFAFSD